MSAPYSPWTDNTVTFSVGMQITIFLRKLDDVNNQPCPIQWQGIWASEAKSGSERDDIEFESSRLWMFEAGLLQK